MERIKAAVVQTRSTEDIEANLRRAEELVACAAQDGAQLICLPENVAFLRIERTDNLGEPLDGPIVERFSTLAANHGVHLLLGSFQRTAPGEAHRVHNCSVLLDAEGRVVAHYDKVHLFDIDIPGSVTFKESDHVKAGDTAVVAEALGCKVGLTICYDLRFAHLYRELVDAGAQIVTVPAAFTAQTGKDHWEVLLRARAIENQCYVLAPNQWGHHGGKRHSYGHSMIIDPWGHVIARVSDGEGWATAWLEPSKLASVRRHLPCLDHRVDALRTREA